MAPGYPKAPKPGLVVLATWHWCRKYAAGRWG